MSSQTNDFSKPQIHCADDSVEGQRLDNFLLGFLKGVPRTRIYRLLRKGEVRVNKGRVAPNYRINSGDLIRIPPIRVAERSDSVIKPGNQLLEALQRSILFEDDRLLIVNKPPGLAVHGGSGLSYGLIEALRTLRPDEKQLELVHRLDRDTSGCLMLAKKRSALRTLHELIRTDKVEKRYLALVTGKWRRSKVTVDAPLLKNIERGGERIVRVDPRGKPALTHFSVVERLGDYTLVEALLETGRTHQIRVHAAHLGTPIGGDSKYGQPDANNALRKFGLNRLFLHAHGLSFSWPGEKKRQKFSAPWENQLESVLNKLRSRR